MKRREAEQPRPDRLPWIRVEVNGEPYTFRVPTPGWVHRWAGKYNDADLAGREELAGELVLAAFDDPAWVLEGESGRAVFDELFCHGWPASVIFAVQTGVIEAAQQFLVTEKEVAEKVRFFGKAAPSAPIT